MSQWLPLATYRLQLNSKFTFHDAIGVLDYLRDLGISHIYASPVFTSRHGSGHGYDVTDPTKIDPDLGGEDAFNALQTAAEERGMSLLLDIVPNHMAASSENRWWMDVLEYGPDSSFAAYFDINWRTPSRVIENKLLLPCLAKPFGEVLDGGELQIDQEDGKFLIRYQEQVFPIAPGSYADILKYLETEGNGAIAIDLPAMQEWQGIVAAAQSIASDVSLGLQAAAERRTKAEYLRERLHRVLSTSPDISEFLSRTLVALNGVVGDPHSFCGLERILSGQHYRLAFWQSASESINYRRFFSITDLVGVRVEDRSVFDATHEAIVRVGAKPAIAGFRVDHIDGLRDPHAYLDRLRERLLQNGAASPYLIVEKILERDESLPSNWPVQGTTGYDYLNSANRLMVDGRGAPALDDFYSRWTSGQVDFAEALYNKKVLVMRTLLAVEMRSLGRELAELASNDRYARDLKPADLAEALVETTACLPVYRTYVQTIEVPGEAQTILADSVRAARSRRSSLPPGCFDFISDVLLLKAPPHVRAEQRETRLAFVSRWQQFTGSIMAKGFEDTALYVYFPLASLNEVGGDPRVLDTRPELFHEFIAKRQEQWPHSMNATTTHDTKRSEDVRARIAVLSEIPGQWESALQEWLRLNARYIRKVHGADTPDRNEMYFFYQTLIGTWPLTDDEWPALVKRLQEYVIKAVREAKVRTRWTRPNEPHESALCDFVASVLDRANNPEFCSSFTRFQERTSLYGMVNSLAQVVLKIACPGVPDCYQGSELWDFRLVDPDNREPVDFGERSAMLKGLLEDSNREYTRHIQELLANWRDSRVKLHVLRRGLAAKRQNLDLFLNGDYRPLQIFGDFQDRAIAFARSYGDDWAIAIVPRCVAAIEAPVVSDSDRSEFWKATSVTLPERTPTKWANALAGCGAPVIETSNHTISLGNAFQSFPVAVLLSR